MAGVSRSDVYYQPVETSAEDILLRHRIEEIHTRWPFCGSRKIVADLRQEGLRGGTVSGRRCASWGRGDPPWPKPQKESLASQGLSVFAPDRFLVDRILKFDPSFTAVSF
ncbi:MAG: hypothetical protein VST70_07995 [Nitrospirota bacterium]|nr:hypothetical protein [Nitrospirota bacterium]